MSVCYELVEHENSFHENHWSIKIVEGEYSGVVYQYDTVSINEENDNVVLTFNTITLENPNDSNLTCDLFESIIGNILVEIIEEQLEEMKDGKDGTSNSQTLTEQ
jgi:hypothetical protein